MNEPTGSEFDRLFYPYLFETDRSSAEQVHEQVRSSTISKSLDLVQLRQRVLAEVSPKIIATGLAMVQAFRKGGTLLVFGNGGSSTDALDLVAQLSHPVRPGWQALPALALAHNTAMVTAVGNDVGFDNIFARQIIAYGQPGDIAFGISSSGNSANILAAFEQAKKQNLLTVGLAGYDGGKMARSAAVDFSLVVPSEQVPRIQEVQATIYHALLEIVFQTLNGPEPDIRQPGV
jgi:D-sedoheptulose 7-phosphate isomerase